MSRLFETDDPLWPHDPAFVDVFVSAYEGSVHPHKLVNFPPVVICSPKKTGKTTQLRSIYKLHERINKNVDGIPIEIPEYSRGYPEQDLRNLLALELKSTKTGSIVDVIETSQRLVESDGGKIIAIINADNLHIDALRWLLYGIRRLKEEREITVKHKVQVIIDGSFAVETMTSGPDSEFPLPQSFPRELTQGEQRNFVQRKFHEIGIDMSASGNQALWHATHGDKYFTQALCQRISEQVVPDEKGYILEKDDVEEFLQVYLQEDQSKDDLKSALLNSMGDLCEYWGGNESILRYNLTNIKDKWETLTPTARAIAYKGGLIRRTGFHGIEVRAPLILQMLAEVERRVRHVKPLLNTYFNIHGVTEEYLERTKKCLREILNSAYNGSLRTLHVGIGIKKSATEVSVQAGALGHGQYTGTWEVRRNDSIKINEEVWCLLWSCDDEENGLISKLKIFPVKHI